jgi:hypothetical protein
LNCLPETNKDEYIVGEYSLEGCWGRPMTRNTVLEGLKKVKLIDIIKILVSRKVMLCENLAAKNEWQVKLSVICIEVIVSNGSAMMSSVQDENKRTEQISKPWGTP